MDGLKPCQFCASTNIVVQVIQPHKHTFATFMPDYWGSATVECLHCDAAIIKDTKEEAIEAWNRRDGF